MIGLPWFPLFSRRSCSRCSFVVWLQARFGSRVRVPMPNSGLASAVEAKRNSWEYALSYLEYPLLARHSYVGDHADLLQEAIIIFSGSFDVSFGLFLCCFSPIYAQALTTSAMTGKLCHFLL